MPPGTYKVFVWHPQIGGMKEYQVTVEPKGQAKLDVTIEAPTGRLYTNEAVENPRCSLGIMGWSENCSNAGEAIILRG